MFILHLTPESLIENIEKRGRDYEKNITKEYLQKIQDSYFSFFRQNPDNKYLVIDVNNLDFVADENHYNKIIEIIFFNDYPDGLNKVIL